MTPEGVTLHVTRMALHTDTTSPEGEHRLYADVERATHDLAQAGLDAIAYGCTAGSMVMPLGRLTDFMAGIAGVPCVATAPSLVHACRALGAARVALATPYHDALNEHERHFLAQNGIEAVALKGLGIGTGGPHEYVRIARVPKDEVAAHARSVDCPAAQALVISCTDFATLDAIPALERALGKPVVTSNQATFWAALRAVGVADRFQSYGRLLAAH
jgi:maleate isomerase/arylmalonate decarboxylase